VYQVVPDIEIINTAIDRVKRRKIGDASLRRTGEVGGVLTTQAVLGHKTGGDPAHQRRDRHLHPRKLVEYGFKIAEKPVEVGSTYFGPLPATQSVATLEVVVERLAKARPREHVGELKPG
jgi:hypothetical protein